MRSQAALYRNIDLELSWSEAELPERERTKHVHRLHPYLGKFVPQVAETFLRRYVLPGDSVWDPFVGSGTTLVEANAFGARSAGCDVSGFNCLLASAKTARYDRQKLLADAVHLAERDTVRWPAPGHVSPYLKHWFAGDSLADLLAFRDRLAGTTYPDLWRIVLSRAARSARLTRHDHLDFPRHPVRGEYFCHKHRRVCRPVAGAKKFLDRYVRDTVRRILLFDEVRTDAPAQVLHGDARALDPPEPIDLVLTSPPYPGLIDYHEQHAYAFDLLGLERRDSEEIGRGLTGYCDGIAAVLRRAARALRPRATVVVVVNDSRALYEAILDAAGLRLEERFARHVNRRTGRRNGEYFEDVLIARRASRS